MFTKPTLDTHRCIDIRHWKRAGMLRRSGFSWVWTRRGEEVARIEVYPAPDHVRLMYRYRLNGGAWQPVDETVRLTETPCHYGGSRLWFVCPGCGKRVAKLWGVSAHFRCRLCCKLPYGSQMESEPDKVLRRKDRLEDRLEAMGDGIYFKPKGMHQRTYERIQAGIEAQELAYNRLFRSRFGASAQLPF
jgi:hypothetical protein